jgi:hypothetical protein
MTDVVLKIYSPFITPRLEYVSEVLFTTILGIEYELISDLRKAGTHPVIVYSDEKVPGSFRIIPSGFLERKGVEPFEPVVTRIGDLPVLFEGAGPDDFPFDVFAASFFMLSRYEEYLPFASDVHGRFKGERSLAYRNGFLHLPVVDLWAGLLAKKLSANFPEIQIQSKIYRALLTVDVDQAYAFRGRGFLRSIGGFVKDFSSTGTSPRPRFRALLGKDEDPYDLFAYLQEQIKKNNCEALYFFPVGDPGDHDHNPSFRDSNYRSLVCRHDTESGSGIHFSYQSSGRKDVLSVEIARYKSITGHHAERCRQHWLLLRMPYTYRTFIEAGIRFDYTMGFVDEPGFRAGIARPFRFYDLLKEETTNLTVVPFQLMDGTLRQYKNMSPEMAIKETERLINITRDVGGQFVSIWHNTSLTEKSGWEGWKNVFEETLRMQKK